MTLPLLSRKSPAFQHTLLALALAAASASASALPSFTWDPSTAGLNGSAFTADNLLISNYSTINFTGGNTFTEEGYLAISAAQLGGTSVLPAGLNSEYGLYIKFSGAGTISSGNPADVITSGELTSLNYTLYGFNGTSTYNYVGGTWTETASGEVALASGSLSWGNVATIPSGDGSTFNPSANAGLNINWLVDGFSSPTYLLGLTSFSNTTSQVTVTDTGFVISQGGGSINFASPVPEPASYAMLISGLAAVGFVARRRNRNSEK
ncbi:flocculation-associated PEP-CTERM protein PepA [Roseateles sp. SL47]|uniref:flocculation-associated PEP-CTERM protein PepA n=1 Tax=Roseateles sp. SL47 TaxID=2995138 RepID=UPI00226ED69B|nr:flocculation-associated PEP-CTERM protein PepA [Roseateles sp. SL47]WAC71355.1 flocculation-associated PEP-CTERM protein PepA [Roseateles sp. SL47]